MTKATVDTFEFSETQDYPLVRTPYDDDIPKEFRAEEPVPPPYDVEPHQGVNNDAAMDLIAWAFEDIGWC